MKKKLLIIFSLILLSASLLQAQSSHDSLNFAISSWNKKSLLTRFDKLLNTYNLNTFLNYGQQYNNLFFGIAENYNSTLIRAVPKNIKDEQYFSFISEYGLSDNVKIGMLANNNILSDDRKIALNQASINNFSVFMKYDPTERIYTAPFFGYSNNNQIGEDDYGYIYGFEGLVDNLTISDFGVQSNVKFLNEDISPRKNTLRLFNISLTNELPNSYKNILGGYFLQNRKDFYYTADSVVSRMFNVVNNIQSRTETNYYLEDKFLLTDLYEGMTLGLNGRASWRAIDRNTHFRDLGNTSPSVFDTKIDEFKLEFETIADYHSSVLDGTIRLNYSERDEKHTAKKYDVTSIFIRDELQKAFEVRSQQEAQKNNKAERISLSFTGNFKLSKKDNLFFSMFHNKLRYDTPSEDNSDDRDELLSIFRIYYIRNISSSFDGFINLEGSFNHIVYIFSERSSNNNISRFIKLGSGGNFNSSLISSRNLFEVSANYTVYDFEDINPNYRSFSFRQLSYQDSTTIRLNSRVYFSLLGYMKYSEQGDFNWVKFSGRPVRLLNEYNLEPKLIYRVKGLTFGSGIRYLLLKTYAFNNTVKNLESSYRSLGPVAEITYLMNERLNLKFLGWYEFIRSEPNNNQREVANMNVQIIWGL